MMLDLDFFRQALLDRRAELKRQTESTGAERAPIELDQTSVGRLSRMDAMQAQAMALAQQQRRENELAAIEGALQRIDRGDYGYCIKCGEEIAEARLRNAPTVTTCIECAR